MEQDKNQETTTSSMPVIPRLDRLDRLLHLLEEKHSLSRRDFSAHTNCAATTENSKTLSSALEEVQQKGTLIERLTMLENRLLQLSPVEMDEGNTSKSSSSTVEVSETTYVGKDSEVSVPKSQDENPITVATQQMQAPGRGVSTDGIMGQGTAQLKSSQQKKKSQTKWVGGFFRLRC